MCHQLKPWGSCACLSSRKLLRDGSALVNVSAKGKINMNLRKKKEKVELDAYPSAFPATNRLRITVNTVLFADHVCLSAHAVVAHV